MGQAPGAWGGPCSYAVGTTQAQGEGSPSKHWPFVGCEWKHGGVDQTVGTDGVWDGPHRKWNNQK